MRIIGGKFKGKNINPPSNFRARPTTDFAKEALFNIINNYFDFDSLTVLDLFSGTGCISYEFASRGTYKITAVEKNFIHAKFIQKQVENMNLTEQIKVIKSDAFLFLKSCKTKYDIIFADPPYDLENIEDIYNIVFSNNLLKEKSFLIIEHSSTIDFGDKEFFFMHKKYGSVNFSFFDPELKK